MNIFNYTFSGALLNQLIQKLMILSGVLAAGVVVFMIPWTQVFLIRVMRRLTVIPEKFRLKSST